MKWLEKLKISSKLYIGFIIVGITSGMVGYFSSSISSDSTLNIIVSLLIAVVISILISSIISSTIYNPLKELTNTVNKVANGEIDINISVENTNEFSNLATALNNLIGNLKDYENSFKLLVENVVEGKFDQRIDSKKYKGFFKEVIENVNSMLNSIIEPLKDSELVLSALALNDYTKEVTKEYKGEYGNLKQKINDVRGRLLSVQDAIVRVSKGDTSRLEEFKRIGKRSENDKMMPAVTGMMETIHNLIEEVNILTKSGTSGQLSIRGDAEKFEGDYKYIIHGINNTLDAVVNPLDEANIVLGNYAINDYTQKMTGNYQGEFKKLSDSINDVNTRFMSLQTILIDIANGDTSRLDEYKAIGKQSQNDKTLPAVISAMETIKNLVSETVKLIEAAAEGKLNSRGEVERFQGGFREIIEGINKMMDTILLPIRDSLEIMDHLADGNLQVMMRGEYKGDFEKLKNSINGVIESFNEVLQGINSSASQVAAGAKQVSDATQMLSQGDTEQASSIEELTASLEQISVQTKQNAENAFKANELAVVAKDDAVDGNNQMKEMVNAMNEINEASSNISKIIKVIDEIAFQTNILSLNAAVEAARAGQHGKGFAVVAEEVRNLAARSANAAKETTTLIEGSIKKVEIGTKIANETAGALNKIVEGVSKATNLVGEIANASSEQSAGITQINQGIMQISQVLQVNSATSEENATSSEELSSQAEMLKELVAKFKLKNVKSNYNNFDRITPEVYNMLENMSKKNQIKNYSTDVKSYDEVAVTKSKIILSDNEFGKY